MKLKNKKQVDNGILLFVGIATVGFASQVLKLLCYTTKTDLITLTSLAVAGAVSIGARKAYYSSPYSKSKTKSMVMPPALAHTPKAKNTHQPCAVAQPTTASKQIKLR